MTRFVRAIANYAAAASAVCLLLLMIVTFVDVMGRYFFKSALPFTVETVQVGMGLVVFFGLALTTLDNGHITVDVISSALPRRIGRAFGIVSAICSIAFFSLMAWQLWERTLSFKRDGLTTEILLLPVYPVAFVMALAAAFAALVCIYLVFQPGEGSK